jgi:hypothetical protein
VPDPLALGALPGALIGVVLAVLGVVYLVLLFTSLALREKR